MQNPLHAKLCHHTAASGKAYHLSWAFLDSFERELCSENINFYIISCFIILTDMYFKKTEGEM